MNSNKVFIGNVTLYPYDKDNSPYKVMPAEGYNGVTLFTFSVQTNFKDTQNNALIDKFIYYCELILIFII
jgi:hypothetical protein